MLISNTPLIVISCGSKAGCIEALLRQQSWFRAQNLTDFTFRHFDRVPTPRLDITLRSCCQLIFLFYYLSETMIVIDNQPVDPSQSLTRSQAGASTSAAVSQPVGFSLAYMMLNKHRQWEEHLRLALETMVNYLLCRGRHAMRSAPRLVGRSRRSFSRGSRRRQRRRQRPVSRPSRTGRSWR